MYYVLQTDPLVLSTYSQCMSEGITSQDWIYVNIGRYDDMPLTIHTKVLKAISQNEFKADGRGR